MEAGQGPGLVKCMAARRHTHPPPCSAGAGERGQTWQGHWGSTGWDPQGRGVCRAQSLGTAEGCEKTRPVRQGPGGERSEKRFSRARRAQEAGPGRRGTELGKAGATALCSRDRAAQAGWGGEAWKLPPPSRCTLLSHEPTGELLISPPGSSGLGLCSLRLRHRAGRSTQHAASMRRCAGREEMSLSQPRLGPGRAADTGPACPPTAARPGGWQEPSSLQPGACLIWTWLLWRWWGWI